jgi:hypothetical protein
MRPALLFALVVPLAAWSGNGPPSPVQCDDEWADCRETCTMDHGTSARPAKRAKFKKCMDRCKFRERDCREAVSEGNRSQVEPEAIEHAKKAAQEDGPYRATSKEERDEVQRKLDEERRVEDERRAEEARRRAESQKAAEARRAGKTAEAEKPAKAERGEKVEPTEKAERAEKTERAEKPATRSEQAEPPPKKAEPREEPKAQKKAAPPPEEEKPAEKKKPKKEERALDEWDPEAL